MVISMLKIRRPLGRLIFNMGIAIPGKTVFLIETAPRYDVCTVSRLRALSLFELSRILETLCDDGIMYINGSYFSGIVVRGHTVCYM